MKVYDDLPIGTKSLEFDPAIGDVICGMLQELCGEPVDIVVIINRQHTWSAPCFITSMFPDEMEGLLVGYGDSIKSGAGRTGEQRSDGVN